ncbi:hypothetical protein K438DRAFT_2009220 [Mycena galopus ATCC 62051]|nr:hypothetical protein K438DRAFT_2009220 [Mycena galopus ATCC 62051]
MKRRRSPTPSDHAWDEPCQGSTSHEGPRSIAGSSKKVPRGIKKEETSTPSAKVPRKESRPRKKRQKAIPEHMKHMQNNMKIWGDRWLGAVQPSTAGSQQGEIQPNGTYTASRSPPPAYRKTPQPLSPVVMESSSSTSHRLSSDFKHSTPLPPSQESPTFDEMFLFESPLCSDGGESFGALSKESSFQDCAAFNFNAETPSFLSEYPYPATIPSVYHPSFTSSPFSGSNALGSHPESYLVSKCNAAPTHPSHDSFSNWILPPAMLPVNSVAHFMDGLPYTPPLSFSSPPNAADFLATAWSGNIQPCGAVHQSMPVVGSYSNSPLYNGYDPVYSLPGNPSFLHHSSDSPLSVYSGPSPQYISPSHLPLPTRTASSGSVASMFSMDNYSHSPNSISPEIFSRCSDYGDFDYNHSPHSGAFTSSPNSVSSVSGGFDMSYANPMASNASRTIPLPFHHTPPLLLRGNCV